MIERKKTESWERRKPMAVTKLFFREKLRRAKHQEEEMMLSTIYAHYRKWAFFRDESPYSKDNFERDLRRAIKADPVEFRGDLLFPCFVREVEIEAATEEARERRSKAGPSLLGQVKALHRIVFADAEIPHGTVLDWLEPTEFERADFRQQRASAFRKDEFFVVVMFKGVRRTIASNLVEKLL